MKLQLDCQSEITQLWRLAWPLLLALGCFCAIGIVDVELAGRLGASAQAAVGIGDQVLYLTLALGTGLSIATSAVVSRSFGAQDHRQLARYGLAAIIVGVSSGTIATLVAWIFAERISSLFGTEECARLAGRYIRLCAPGNAPFIVIMVLSAIFRSIERPRNSLLIWLITGGLTVVASLVLFQFGALANSLDALCIAWDASAVVGCILGFVLLVKSKLGLLLYGTNAFAQAMKEVVSIAIPAALAEMVGLISEFVVFSIMAVTDDGVHMQAAWTILLKIEETFVIMPTTAICLALAVCVGQSIGRCEQDKAIRTATIVACSSFVVALIVGCLVAFLAPPLATQFSTDGKVSAMTAAVLYASPLLFPALTVRLVMFSTMEGAGRTTPPMMLAFVGNIIKLAICWILIVNFDWSMNGAIVALCLSRCYLGFTAVRLFLGLSQEHLNSANAEDSNGWFSGRRNLNQFIFGYNQMLKAYFHKPWLKL